MDKNENKKINFSVAIITFNEEANIRDCIESVHNFADEIVLLDSMSTDKTIEIAKAYAKVKIFSQKFKGHIEQKNDALLTEELIRYRSVNHQCHHQVLG